MSELAPETPVAEAAPEAPAEPSVEYAQIPADEWAEVSEAMQLLRQAQEPQYELPEVQQQAVQFDPFAENASEQLRSIIREEMAPYATYQEQQILGEAEERAKDIVSDWQAQNGEFIQKEKANDYILARANQMVGDFQQRFGYGPKAAEAALAQACTEYRDYEISVGKAYHEREINQIRGLSGAPREPAVNGQQGGQQVTRQGGNEMDLVRRYFGG